MVIARASWLSGALLLAASSPAGAQDIGGVFDMGGLVGTAAMDPVIEQSRDMAIRQGEADPLPDRPRANLLMRNLSRAFGLQADGRSAEPASAPKDAVSVDAAALNYRPSMELRRKHLASFVKQTRAADPAGAAKLEQLFATDIIGQIDAVLNRFGMRTDNVADAFTVWLISAWQASRGIADEPMRSEMSAVKTQVERTLSSISAFDTADDATKQEVAEACLIQAALIDGYMENARGDSEQLGRIAEAVRRNARRMGFDLDGMDLGTAGFRLSR